MTIALTHPWALLISIAAALAYGLFYAARPPSPNAAIVRAGFVGGLVYALYGAPLPLFIALVAAAIGDLFFAFAKHERSNPIMLVLGLAAFFLMQMAFLATFLVTWLLAPDGAPLWPRYGLMIIAALEVAVFVALFWLWRGAKHRPAPALNPLDGLGVLGALALGALLPFATVVAVIATNAGEPTGDPLSWSLLLGGLFICIVLCVLRRRLGLLKLAAMAFIAVNLELLILTFWLPWAGWGAMLGAYLFLLANALYLWLRLRPSPPPHKFLPAVQWWTYVAAQSFLIWGAIAAARASFV